MVQPIQYQVPGVTDPFASVVQGLRLGATLSELDAARATQALKQQELQAKLAQQQRVQDALAQFNAKPREQRTDADYESLGMLLPAEQSNALRQWWEVKGKTEKERLKLDIGQTLAALRRDPAAAEQKLNLLAEGYRNKGDTQSADMYSAFAKSAKTAPLETFDSVLGTVSGTFGKDWTTSILQAGTGREAEAAALRKATADANEAVAKAKKAQAEAATAADKEAAEVRLKIAQANEAEVKARVARTEEKLTGGVQATADIRTAVAATNLPDNQKRALVELANVKAPKTIVDIGRGAEAEKYGDFLVRQFEQVSTEANVADKLLGNIGVAKRILNDPKFVTGTGAEFTAAAASVLSALGVSEATKYAANAEIFRSQANQVTLNKFLEQKGVQTNQDGIRVDNTFALLKNTKDANKFIVAFAESTAQRAKDKKRFFTKYRVQNKTLDGADAAWEESPEGSKSIFDYPAMRPFRNIQAPPAPAPARPAAAAPAAAPAAQARPPGFGPRAVTGTVTPAESFPVAPQPGVRTQSLQEIFSGTSVAR